MNTLTTKNWNNETTRFEVGQTVLVHDDDGALWSAPIATITPAGFLHLVSDETDAFELPSICEVIMDGAKTTRFTNNGPMPDTKQFDYLIEVAAWADTGTTEYVGIIGRPSRHVLEEILGAEILSVRQWIDDEASNGNMDARADEPQVAVVRQRPDADEDDEYAPACDWPILVAK